MISVIVTVGPNPKYKQFLGPCLESIREQQTSAGTVEIVLVDDAAHLDGMADKCKYIKNPWNLGQVASLNIGIASATYDWVFVMGGSDDKLLPGCIEACWLGAVKHGKEMVYFPIIETSLGEKSNLPQGVWLFHRSLWAKYGGYPKEAITEVDATLCSLYLSKKVPFISCGKGPLYWHREWEEALTKIKFQSAGLVAIGGILRGMVIADWRQPDWVRGYGYDV